MERRPRAAKLIDSPPITLIISDALAGCSVHAPSFPRLLARDFRPCGARRGVPRRDFCVPAPHTLRAAGTVSPERGMPGKRDRQSRVLMKTGGVQGLPDYLGRLQGEGARRREVAEEVYRL